MKNSLKIMLLVSLFSFIPLSSAHAQYTVISATTSTSSTISRDDVARLRPALIALLQTLDSALQNVQTRMNQETLILRKDALLLDTVVARVNQIAQKPQNTDAEKQEVSLELDDTARMITPIANEIGAVQTSRTNTQKVLDQVFEVFRTLVTELASAR